MGTAARRSTRGRGSGREVQWVTFGLLAICVVMHSVMIVASRRVNESAEAKLEVAIAYLVDHPHLEPGPILAERVETTRLEQRREAARRARERRGAPPIARRVQEKQKQDLDRLVAEAFAGAADLPAQRWGLRATDVSPVALLSHVFLHESGAHLVCSLALLLVLGFQLESTWGSGVFAGFFLLASVASGACFALANPGFPAPLIGLSGVVAALLTAYAIAFRSLWHHPLYFSLLIVGGLFAALPARFGLEWSLATGLGGLAPVPVHHPASYWAVGGGLVFGLLGQLVIAPFRGPAASASESSRGKSSRRARLKLRKVIDSRAAGRPNAAYGLLCEVLQETPDDREALLVMWDVANDQGRPKEAAVAMLRAIRDEVKRNDSKAAVEHWVELKDRGLHADAEPALLIRLALMLQQNEYSNAAVEALEQALEKSQEGDAAVIAARVARASRDLAPDTARDAAWQALGSIDLEFEERQRLESLLAEIGSEIETGESAEGIAVNFDPVVENPSDSGRPSLAAAGGSRSAAWVDLSLDTTASSSPAEPRPVVLEDLVGFDAGPGDERDPRDSFQRPEAIALDDAVRGILILPARPLALHPDGLRIEAEHGVKKRLPLEKLEAISVAAVAGLSEKPVLLIDLAMNWTGGVDEPLKVVRFRGDQFDARSLAAGAPDSPLDALREFVGVLLDRSRAVPLPDLQSAQGMPFASFDDLAAYQRSVLGVEEDDSA